MDASKLAVKFFLVDAGEFDALQLVPVFHRWIQEQSIADHVLIDVADYTHVPSGPGVVLVSHEANFSLDYGGGRAGLLYNRKRPTDGAFSEKLALTLASGLDACRRIEQALPGKIRFATGDFLFRIYDRLLAPNTQPTFDSIRNELTSVLQKVYGGRITLHHNPDPGSVFEVRVTADSSPAIESLLERLGEYAPASRST